MLLLILLACQVGGDTPAADCWTVDVDGDGAEGKGGCAPTDCDDADPRVHPGAAERCDGVDEDCDGAVDEAPSSGPTWFQDDDGDGYGAAEVVACAVPTGAVAFPGDCDDADPAVSPDAPETCNGTDDDCDGATDEDAVDAGIWFVDADSDGFGADPVAACSQPAGTATSDGDCDDSRDDVAPGATEQCDEADNNCDGQVDEDAADAAIWFEDADGDGFGATPIDACTLPPGATAVPGDCDDADATVFPGAPETCDALDRDCDGDMTLGATDPGTWFEDADGDGVGAAELRACTQPAGSADVPGDCDDSSPEVFPGAAERCDDRDEDCDGSVDEDPVDGSTWYADADGDGFGADPILACARPDASTDAAGDCDDSSADVNPAAIERCNERDDDCDGDTDEDAEGAVERWVDRDADGWGDPLGAALVCATTRGFVGNGGDCDDADPTLFNTCPADCTTLVSPPGDVSFTGEGAGPDMAEFCLHYNAIGGDLSVDDVAVDDLRHLSCLCEVDGSVEIVANALLANLSGLDGLERIGGDLYIEGNRSLATLDSLGALTEVGGTLTVEGNDALLDHRGLATLHTVGTLNLVDTGTSSVGLEALQTVTGDLNAAGLVDLGGLTSLQSIGGTLTLSTMTGPTLTPLSALESIGNLTLAWVSVSSLEGLEGVTTIPGDITLTYSTVNTDFRGLSGLRGAVGAISISGSNVRALTGLEGITSASDLSISGTALLTDLDGLAGLQELSGSLVVNGCGQLASLDGPTSLEAVGGAVEVQKNEALTTLHGLDSLRTAGGLTITYNQTLASLDGLGALERVDGSFTVHSNTRLPDFTGLTRLAEVTGNVDLTATGGNFSGLEALERIGGNLDVDGASAGLEALREVDGLLYVNTATCEGLESLASAGELYVYATTGSEACPLPALTDVTGELRLYKAVLDGVLPALQRAGSIEISYCASDTTTATLFPRLESVAGPLLIEDCTTLRTLADLPSLARVDGELTFDNLDVLTALPAMPLLRRTGGLALKYDNRVTDLSGLGWLREVDGDLVIQGNSDLVDLTPLYGIGSITGSFKLASNTLIEDAEAEALRDAVGAENIGGTITISE